VGRALLELGAVVLGSRFDVIGRAEILEEAATHKIGSLWDRGTTTTRQGGGIQ
jgi:hypothetical protein